MATKLVDQELNVKECIKSITGSELSSHIELAVVSEGGRRWVVCSVCGGRWSVKFSQVDAGDGYCEQGATNYYKSDGKLLRRV
ncbi:MAG: hypothetical protein JWN74_2106 [Acidobacteriaceae bacterium]|jgi:hypothetical protein|nr:hypothetical protein [Acidobacteriaceae bacterium]